MSLADENAEIVRRAYEAFNTGDMEALTAVFDEDATWHTPGRSFIGGDFEGREATFGQFGRFVGESGGTFKAILQQVYASPEGQVVALHHNTAERNGKQLDVDCCIVFELKDGRCVYGAEHFFDLYAWDEFWS